MMYFNIFENIDLKEVYFDILIFIYFDVEFEDFDIYWVGWFMIEKIGWVKFIECFMLVDWDKGFWKILIDRNSEVNYYWVKFWGGFYLYF